MAAAESSIGEAAEMEVLDLRHFSARQMRPLLEEEARVWEQRLLWDYRASVELLLEYLDQRVLPGFVATGRGGASGNAADSQAEGYAFCVYEGAKAVVGDAFAAGRDLRTTRLLLTHLLELAQHTPNVDRVESQLLLYDAGELTELFAGHGFRAYRRLFLECGVAGVGEAMRAPAGMELLRWSSELYQGAGELIHAAYRGHLDSEINDQYRTLHGSLRFLHNIVRFPGCGVFDAEASWVLREAGGGRLLGMILCSRVRSDMGHITQLCVIPELRGSGLGRGLMRHCAAGLEERGFGGISLTVTERNVEAVGLYERLGFKVRQRFEAMVWER